MKHARVIVVLALVTLASGNAWGRPEFLTVFRQTYVIKSGTPLDQAKCVTCHVAAGPPERNSFGAALKHILDAAHTKTLTPEILHQLDAQDCDGDGWSSGAEIRAGTLPGDPTSFPAGTPGPVKSGVANHASAPPPMIPLHSFHPIIVHFPIALFLFGGFLEAWGMWKRRLALREAGFVCLSGASVTSFAAIATGLTAMYRNGFALRGMVLTHLVLALSASLGMALTALLGWSAVRAGRPRDSRVYWVVLFISLALVGLAGHWGGLLVYGA